MTDDHAQIDFHGKQFSRWIKNDEIEAAIERLAQAINSDYEGKDLVVIGVLDGVIMVLASLVQKLSVNLTIELIKLKSYEGQKSTGEITTLLPLNADIRGKHVLVVEDIVDTGQTLSFLLKQLEKEQPKSVEVATLLLKEAIFKGKFPIKYVGKKIASKFVVGFGMDFDGLGRQLPDIYVPADSAE